MIEGLGHLYIDQDQIGFKKRLVKIVVNWLYKISLATATTVLFLNSDDFSDFNTLGLVSEKKCIIVGGIGVDLDHYKKVTPSIEQVTFITVARLTAEKGINELIIAARMVKQQYPNVRFWLLGDVDANPTTLKKQQVENWVEENLISWPGHVDPKEWLSAASVFVLPSYREGVPVSSQEAMALGLPIITTHGKGWVQRFSCSTKRPLNACRSYDQIYS